MASSGGDGGGSARRNREGEDHANASGSSKKPRPSNRRVSFGGAYVRTFDSSHFISGNNNQPSPDDNPARRGLVFNEDDQEDDTFPRNDSPSLPHPDNNDQTPLIDSRNSTPPTSFAIPPMDSMDLQNSTPRPNDMPIGFTADEDFNPDLIPRFSILHGLSEDDADTIFDRASLGGQSIGDQSLGGQSINRRQSTAPFGSQTRPSAAAPFSGLNGQQERPSAHPFDLENLPDNTDSFSHRPSMNKPPLPRNNSNPISISQPLRPINSSEPRAPAPSQKQVVRPSLPANRQLFANDDMDDTIHFDSTLVKQPKSILKASSLDTFPNLSPPVYKSPVLNSATKTMDQFDATPPQSELGSKIRTAALERSALRNTANRSERSMQDEPSLLLDTPTASHEASFPLVAKFIGDVGLSIPFERNFAENISMVDGKPDIEEINLDNKHGRVFAAIMKKIVIQKIDDMNEQVRSEVTELQGSIQDLSLKLEENPPEIVSQFANAGVWTPESRIVVQTGLSRLRRYMDLQASHEWRNFKKKLNDKKKTGFQEAIHALEIGEKEVKKSNDSLVGYLEKLENEMANEEIRIDENILNAASMPVSEELREQLLANFESRSSQSRKSQVETNKQEALTEKLNEVRSRIERLESECRISRQRIADGPGLNHKKEMEKLKKEYAERIRRTGIDTRKASDTELVIRIANIADVTVKINKTKITSLDVQAVAFKGVLPGPMEAFVNDSVTMVSSCINNCNSVEQLPQVLDLMKKHLEEVKKAGMETAKYIDLHDMEWKESVEESECVYTPFRLLPRYFSVEKHLRFGAVILLKYFPPVFDGESDLKEEGSCEIAVERVVKIIGQPPSKEEIEKKIRKTAGTICDKMVALWDFCN